MVKDELKEREENAKTLMQAAEKFFSLSGMDTEKIEDEFGLHYLSFDAPLITPFEKASLNQAIRVIDVFRKIPETQKKVPRNMAGKITRDMAEQYSTTALVEWVQSHAFLKIETLRNFEEILIESVKKRAFIEKWIDLEYTSYDTIAKEIDYNKMMERGVTRDNVKEKVDEVKNRYPDISLNEETYLASYVKPECALRGLVRDTADAVILSPRAESWLEEQKEKEGEGNGVLNLITHDIPDKFLVMYAVTKHYEAMKKLLDAVQQSGLTAAVNAAYPDISKSATR